MSTTYTGNPSNDPSAITIPSDGQGPIKAADVNPAFEGLMDKAARISDLASALTVSNYPYYQNTSWSYAAAWLPAKDSWIIAAKSGDEHGCVRLWDGSGQSASAAGVTTVGDLPILSTEHPVSIAAHPSEDKAVVVYDGTMVGDLLQLWLYSAGTLVVKTVSVDDNGNVGRGVIFFNGKWRALFSVVAGTVHLLHSDDGVTWAEDSPVAVGVGDKGCRFIMTASAGVCLAVQHNSVFESADTPYGSTATYLRSTDGVTWTVQTFPAGAVWTGATYDATRGLFVVVGKPADDTFFVYTSPDGITWTKRGDTMSANSWGVAVHDAYWVVAVSIGLERYAAVSDDLGVTWTLVGNAHNYDGGSAKKLESLPISNGRQIAFLSDSGVKASLRTHSPTLTLGHV